MKPPSFHSFSTLRQRETSNNNTPLDPPEGILFLPPVPPTTRPRDSPRLVIQKWYLLEESLVISKEGLLATNMIGPVHYFLGLRYWLQLSTYSSLQLFLLLLLESNLTGIQVEA
ncbi:uncharacterized protein LOC114181767 isoform X2 [Vigna unguiculata]|uniref:uncharacterized protein LOC114181767 isoform X2 n=1 Tax=Vigna unguiculata TaxID=3917 RepID=UPI001016FA4E|nr:uncharacterized protein LOC114181767 isoform X2 [Vigna unguiculata]